jgi:hypothetical protein
MPPTPSVSFVRVTTNSEKEAINQFLLAYNDFDAGSSIGYVAYYAALAHSGELVAASKFCPMHTPQAARFFGGEAWCNVYNLQRLAAHNYPGKLSKFVRFCLKDQGNNPNIHYVGTYADTGKINSLTGAPQLGTVYRYAGAVYCGMTRPSNKIIGYRLDGKFRSMRNGKRTLRLADIPEGAIPERATMKHRWAWGVGPQPVRAVRHTELAWRMKHYEWQAIYQPRLLLQLWRRYGSYRSVRGLLDWPEWGHPLFSHLGFEYEEINQGVVE